MSDNPRYDAETIDLFAIELDLQPASSAFTPNMPALMALQEMKAQHKKLLDLWAAVEATSFLNADGSTADWARAYRNFEQEIRAQLARRR